MNINLKVDTQRFEQGLRSARAFCQRFCSVPGLPPPRRFLKWGFVGGTPDGLFERLPPVAVKAVFFGAFGMWSQVSGAEPQYTADQDEADVLIGTDILGPCVAEADFSQAKSWLFFSYEDVWTISDSPRLVGFDLLRVAAKMAGHALGLPELPAGNLLAAAYDLDIDWPQQADAAAAVALYGEPREPLPPEDAWLEWLEPTLLGVEQERRQAA